MAAATQWEFLVNTLGVWQIVTIATLRNSFMLIGMTAYTGNVMVFGFGCSQLAERQIMTGSTENILCRVGIFENQRLVDIVTGSTISLGHILRMRFMALQALRNCSMGIGVAEVTGEGGVLARLGD
jgi:hypothetical protein